MVGTTWCRTHSLLTLSLGRWWAGNPRSFPKPHFWAPAPLGGTYVQWNHGCHSYLVGGWASRSEKYENQLGLRNFQYMEFQTTNQKLSAFWSPLWPWHSLAICPTLFPSDCIVSQLRWQNLYNYWHLVISTLHRFGSRNAWTQRAHKEQWNGMYNKVFQ